MRVAENATSKKFKIPDGTSAEVQVLRVGELLLDVTRTDSGVWLRRAVGFADIVIDVSLAEEERRTRIAIKELLYNFVPKAKRSSGRPQMQGRAAECRDEGSVLPADTAVASADQQQRCIRPPALRPSGPRVNRRLVLPVRSPEAQS